ncbi:MAG: glutamate---cysteine ligase / carboxylate-amine ligase [Solirubrobacteraceae bacterium]|nr:glutamate---cysteine ligase / carboxylate-amine ligase [Solirubrobacteraceae bacterium]
MALDLQRARETFESSTDLTVGVEEEFHLLDPATLRLADRYDELNAAGQEDPVLAESLAGELIASEIEIRSGRAEDMAEALTRQRDHRRRLFALAAELGIALGATGTNPLSDYREQRIIDTEHYRRLNEQLRYVAWRNNTWSLHVHAGVRGADRAVRVCDRLRPVLPLLLAISSSSPYIDGQDSGLHSGRTQIFTRNFPRCGIPEPLGSWDAFADYLRFLERTRSIVEFTQVWWSIRPHIHFGTVEVRICDAQSTAGESEALAGLILACVAQAARDEDEGVPLADLPGRLVEENLWRAIRHGQDGQLIDLERVEEYPGAEAAPRLLEWTAPVRRELGVDPVFPELNAAQRQRRLIDTGASPREVFEATVRETAQTYATEVVA